MKTSTAILIALGLALLIFVGIRAVEKSLAMSYQLRELQAEFEATAAHPDSIHTTLTDNGVQRTLCYGNRLDRITAKRDSILAAKGYIMIGRWWVQIMGGEPIASTASLYIMVP
jgi:hypothetical protein